MAHKLSPGVHVLFLAANEIGEVSSKRSALEHDEFLDRNLWSDGHKIIKKGKTPGDSGGFQFAEVSLGVLEGRLEFRLQLDPHRASYNEVL